MNQLTLEWVEAGQVQTQTITDQQHTKQPGIVRIGRDPAQCDLVLQHPTVSKLHVEIFFDPSEQLFYLRNLRASNPPTVDRRSVVQGVVPLHPGAKLRLGHAELEVTTIALELAPTLISPPPAQASTPTVQAFPPPIQASTPTVQAFPPPIQAAPAASTPHSHPPAYGLRCPTCNHISPYERRGIGCNWCGTSLAAAPTELIPPDA